MRRLINYFIRGLVVTAPLALTLYVCWDLFHWVDRWLGLSIPGVGFAITVVLITLIGVLASSLFTRGAVAAVDRALQRLPFVRLVYGSTRDFLNAFVGEKRRFDKPVLLAVAPRHHHPLERGQLLPHPLPLRREARDDLLRPAAGDE